MHAHRKDTLVRQLAARTYGRDDVLDTIEQQVTFLLRQVLAGDAWEARPLLDRLVAIAQKAEGASLSALETEPFAKLVQRFLDTNPNLFAASEWPAIKGSDAQKRDVVTRLHGVLKLLSRLAAVHAAWRSAIDADSGKLDVAQFVSFLLAADGPLLSFCEQATTPACRVLRSLHAPDDGTNPTAAVLAKARPLFSYAGKGEYVEAAQVAIGYVFQRMADKTDAELGIYERFARSVVVYVLEAGDDGAPAEAARLAFRNAAVELIQYLGRGGGVRRWAYNPEACWGKLCSPRFIPIVLPHFALRASWSPSYVNASGRTVRYLASANWINFRFPIRRRETTYFGLELSLVDPLAPLNELALRKVEATHFYDSSKLLANAFSPRLEALAGSPALSTRLVISAGISLRMVAPIVDAAATARNNGEASYRYTTLWDAESVDGTSLWPRFIEFGLAAKYIL